MGLARTSYVCLPCRRSYKQSYPGACAHARICPRCGAELIHVGSAFAAPRRNDSRAWRVLSELLGAGVGFHKSCCGGPGFRPRTPGDVRRRRQYAQRRGIPLRQALTQRVLP
ncbi:hypothetical protein ACFVMC_25460 [Nocardia sp. NPDC127579]|uniref:hypothetical protein n=1 Tax=Nocardia sp. NPDC127579 TaxID=3345402 RepID=UPI00363CC7EF